MDGGLPVEARQPLQDVRVPLPRREHGRPELHRNVAVRTSSQGRQIRPLRITSSPPHFLTSSLSRILVRGSRTAEIQTPAIRKLQVPRIRAQRAILRLKADDLDLGAGGQRI